MLFLKRKEVNYELYFKNTFNRIYLNKLNYSNKYIFAIKPKIEIFFWFKKIKEENLSLIQLYNHCIFFWLITGNIGQIKKIANTLNRGIRYYRYIYYCNIDYFFEFINFINETLSSVLHETVSKIHIKTKDNYLASYSDLHMFTNLKLSTSLYLNSIHEQMYLNIYNNKRFNLQVYLNCLKIK